MTPVKELLAAAARLREAASMAPAGPWRFVPDLYWERSAITSDTPGRDGWDALVMDVHNDSEHPAARWAALVHPGLAEPLAAWLEETADVMTCLGPPTVRDGYCWDAMGGRRSEWDHAIAVARVINEGAPSDGHTVGDDRIGAADTADDLPEPAEAGDITPVTRVHVREANTAASSEPDLSDCGSTGRTADATAVTVGDRSGRNDARSRASTAAAVTGRRVSR